MDRRLLISADEFKISKPGKDVITEGDQPNLIFSHEWRGLAVRQRGTVSAAVGGSDFYYSDEGYIPIIALGSKWDASVGEDVFTQHGHWPAVFIPSAQRREFYHAAYADRCRVWSLTGGTINVDYVVFHAGWTP